MPKDRLVEYRAPFTAFVEEFAAAREIRYDLVHSHYWLSGLAALDLRSEWGTPIVHMFHTLAAMKNRVAREGEIVDSGLRFDSEGKLLRQADRIVAATQAELAQFQWLYHADTRRVAVIPPGVDTAHFYPIHEEEAREFAGVPADKRMVLFVGRVEPLKGIDGLLNAIAVLKAQDPELVAGLCLAVIGGEPEDGRDPAAEMARLQEMRRALQIEDTVTFLGRKAQDSLPYYYSAAEIVVVPSHYESFGLVALEAMACGTPVVASETGGLAYLVKDGETGFHVPTGDPQALADRLGQLLRDELLRERLGRQAAEYARRYAWPIIADQIIDLYQGTLGLHA
jgi:D-inositol-3-phosphate glycosyltransferase